MQVRSYEAVDELLRLDNRLIREASARIQRLLDELRGLDLEEVDPAPEAVVRRAESRVGEGGSTSSFTTANTSPPGARPGSVTVSRSRRSGAPLSIRADTRCTRWRRC